MYGTLLEYTVHDTYVCTYIRTHISWSRAEIGWQQRYRDHIRLFVESTHCKYVKHILQLTLNFTLGAAQHFSHTFTSTWHNHDRGMTTAFTCSLPQGRPQTCQGCTVLYTEGVPVSHALLVARQSIQAHHHTSLREMVQEKWSMPWYHAVWTGQLRTYLTWTACPVGDIRKCTASV